MVWNRLVRVVLPCLAIAILAAMSFATALATTMRPKDVDCPVCEKRITVQVIGSWTGDGADGDMGPRVRGGAVLPFSVWTCTHCRWSAWSSDFEKAPKPETRARILGGFEPPVPLQPGTDQREIPAWVKYELASRIAEWEGEAVGRRGARLLRGAWAVRQDASRARRPIDDDPALSARFEAAWSAAYGDARTVQAPPGEALILPLVRHEAAAAAAERRAASVRQAGAPDPVAELVAACLHRRIGENAAAGPILARLAGDEGAPPAVRETARAVQDSIARERAFQEAAVALLLGEVGQGDVAPEERAAMRISVADTLRRIGREKDAVPVFLLALGDADPPAWATALARHGLAKAGAGEDAAAAIAAAEIRARERLRRDLLDPERAGDAARLVGSARDESFFPDLEAALAHESEKVRAAALVALHRMDGKPLPPGVRAALEKIVRNRGEERGSKESALSLLAQEGSADSLRLFREASCWAGPKLRDEALRGLRRAGTEEDVPVLLEFLAAEKGTFGERERKECLRTLTVLANREFADEGAARVWWETAKGSTREDWVAAGFRSEGVEIASIRGRDAVPVLIGLLEKGPPRSRFNALRALKDVTGQRFGWDSNADIWYERPPSRGDSTPDWVDEWRAWWAAEQPAAKPAPDGGR